MTESQLRPPQDALSVSLLQARRDLWKAPPRYLPGFFGPLREFFLDPGLCIAAMVLPVATRNAMPRLNSFLAYFIQKGYQPCLQFFYRFPSGIQPRLRGTENQPSIQEHARSSLLSDPSAPGNNRVIVIDPPSQLESVVLGVLAFLISSIGDILGALTNPKKYQGWMNACTQLESYLASTGVSHELHSAIVQPLLHGRLLSNMKILSDIQFEALCVDRAKAAQFPVDNDNSSPDLLKEELKWGHKWMRFATAAYGVEMIRSALDRETDSDRVLREAESAIAFHCQIEESDVLLLYTDDVPENHILHHFLAVDHASKSIVLALRGTLSLSGAIVDLRGIAAAYCTGQAHEGMAEMADNVWTQSGEAILKIISDEKYRGYTFILTGHSLGAGTACLLNIKLHVEGLLGSDWPIRCYAFAPPPTFLACTAETDDDKVVATSPVDQAIQHTVAYINDNDVVPHLSISAIRRLAFLFKAVDAESLKLWFWKRWRIFYDYDKVSKQTVQAVVNKVAGGKSTPRAIQGACELIIPARVVVWCYRNNLLGKYEAFACDPTRVAQGQILLSQDMLTDHLPEPYECALDELVET